MQRVDFFFPNPASYEFVTDIWYRQYSISLFYECIYTYTYAPLIPPPPRMNFCLILRNTQ